MSDRSPTDRIDASLEELGRLCREARHRERRVDMSSDAVERRLRRVSQLRDLCLYLRRMGVVARRDSASPDSVITPLHELVATLGAGDLPSPPWLRENAHRLGDSWGRCEDGVLMLTVLALLRRSEDVVRIAERIVSAVEGAVPVPNVAQPLVATVRRWIAEGGLAESDVAAQARSVQFDLADYVRSNAYDALGAQIHLFSMIEPDTDLVEAARKLATCAAFALMRGRDVAGADRKIADIVRGCAPPLDSSDLARFEG